jgi:elongation factor Ts
MVTAQLIKTLRDMTGAGMLDCKKALEETNGNIEKAVDYLREKGIAKAAKKADRIAAEGLCEVRVSGDHALLFELNSETDFVSKNEQFLTLIDTVGSALIQSSVSNTEEALEFNVDGKTIDTWIKEASAKIGEKFNLRRVTRFTKSSKQTFGMYKHMGGRIAALVLLEGGDDVVAKDIAMHIAAQKPQFLDQSQVDPETLAHEKHILTQIALQEGKPANIVEKMIVGRVQKFLKDICLVDQPFVKDPDQTVSQYALSKQAKIISFKRLEVGEGIEKKAEDFAEEVKKQVAQK